MITAFRRWLGIVPAVPKAQLEALALRCAERMEEFDDRIPSYFHNNISTMAGMWAIALYTQMASVAGEEGLRDDDWRRAGRLVAHHMMACMFPDIPKRWRETRNLRNALQGQLLGVCRLWIAAFGFPPEQTTLNDADHMAERLMAMMNDEELDLRERFWLPTDAEITESAEEYDEDEDDEVTEFCRVSAAFFRFCAGSEPQKITQNSMGC